MSSFFEEAYTCHKMMKEMKIPYEAFLAGLNVSGRSRPSDKEGPGHPDPEIRGGGGGRPPGPLPWIHHCLCPRGSKAAVSLIE